VYYGYEGTLSAPFIRPDGDASLEDRSSDPTASTSFPGEAPPEWERKVAVEGSLKRLRLERIDVYQLHIPDPAVSFDASMETLARLREQGKIRRIGLSNVTLEHLERARKIVPIVSVQNRYSFVDREWDYLLNHCEKDQIAFIPWAPMGQNRQANEMLEKAANEIGATPLQVALAWLLRRSSVALPIPGTSTVAHVEENVAAAGITLPDELFKELSEVTPPPASLR